MYFSAKKIRIQKIEERVNQLRTIGVRRIIIGTAALALLTATGCGSGKTKSGSNFANPPAASQYNNYAGGLEIGRAHV